MKLNKFISKLGGSPSSLDLKLLVGQEISVIKTQTEWKKQVVIVNSFEVDRISCTVDIETGHLTDIKLWGEMRLNGAKRFDSWLDLKSLKMWCEAYDRSAKL